ncbi:MAG TPA: hypothetical protein DDX92_10110 [Flavobacteriales bacterium]|jgi:hypothetical protein|nr:hypothetical protein [Flavobacteriales bacterium]
MSEKTEEQIEKWLRKLQRESWQLELLVSAFTIFLLLAAQQNLEEFIISLDYEYYGPVGILIFFLVLIRASIIALTVFLVLHLLLRGFWIGTIGLRSVQSTIDFERLNYSQYFKEKLKKKVIGLDRLVILLDELCSVLFSLSFLIIFTIISFGLYFLFLVSIGVILDLIFDVIGIEAEGVSTIFPIFLVLVILLTGVVYLIDYFTLGFFKKYRRISKVYYPIYKFYSFITLSFISRSIYYSLISKYSKKRIRILLTSFLLFVILTSTFSFDQQIFYPDEVTEDVLQTNYYDDQRDESEYVEKVSLESRFITGDFVSLFIRYNPSANERIQSNCSDFKPLKNDGINSSLKFEFDNGLSIGSENIEDEDKKMLLQCLTEYYEVSINDSVCEHLKYHFYEHPSKNQKGILTVLSTDQFRRGENVILVKTNYIDSDDSVFVSKDYAHIPVWISKE